MNRHILQPQATGQRREGRGEIMHHSCDGKHDAMEELGKHQSQYKEVGHGWRASSQGFLKPISEEQAKNCSCMEPRKYALFGLMFSVFEEPIFRLRIALEPQCSAHQHMRVLFAVLIH